MNNTLSKKPVWVVVMKDQNDNRKLYTFNYAAYDMTELLTFFNANAVSRIVKIEKTEMEVNYHYPSV